MICFVDLFTFFLVTYWLLKNIKNIGRSSRFLIGVLIYVLYVLPLGLDWLYEMADYSYTIDRVGFILPRMDILTVLIYDGLILVTLYCILLKNTNITNAGIKTSLTINKGLTSLLYAGMILPALTTIVLLKEPDLLFAFQWRELGEFTIHPTYRTIERFTYLGISCSLLLLFSKSEKNIFLTLLFKLVYISFIFMNVCIQGKRAILFYAIINFLIMFYFQLESYKKAGKEIVTRIIPVSILAIIGFVFIVSFTSYVKSERGYEEGSSVMYTTTRIDMFRDDRVRMAIYHSIYSIDTNVPSIVSYPGQTFFVDIMSFIPFNYIVEYLDVKGTMCQTRFTHALINKDPSRHIDNKINWMTVTIFAEIISNIGILLSFFFIPYLCVWFSNIIDKYAYPNNALILSCFALLQLFDFTYVSVFIEFTIILCFFSNNRMHFSKTNQHQI